MKKLRYPDIKDYKNKEEKNGLLAIRIEMTSEDLRQIRNELGNSAARLAEKLTEDN